MSRKWFYIFLLIFWVGIASFAQARVVQPQDLYWLYSFLKIPSQDKIWVNLDYTLPFQDQMVSRSILGCPLSDILLSADLQLKLDTLRILEGLDYGSREVRFRIVVVPLVYTFLSNRFPGSGLIPVESSIAAVSETQAGGIVFE